MERCEISFVGPRLRIAPPVLITIVPALNFTYPGSGRPAKGERLHGPDDLAKHHAAPKPISSGLADPASMAFSASASMPELPASL